MSQDTILGYVRMVALISRHRDAVYACNFELADVMGYRDVGK